MGRLDDKVAIITGGARGQGEATARLFVSEGARVIVADVLDDAGRGVASSLGRAARFVSLDVSSESAWAEVVARTLDEWGAIDVLINNAAIIRPSAIEDTTLDNYMAHVNVNQVGTFLGMRSVIPTMKGAGRGSIVNISSIDGLQSKNGLIAYTATKFAIRGMTKTAAIELGPHGIRVNSVHPGGVNTVMGNPHGMKELETIPYQRQAIPRIGEPSEIAHVSLFLASDDASYVTGAEISADGGWRAGNREPGLPGSGADGGYGYTAPI